MPVDLAVPVFELRLDVGPDRSFARYPRPGQVAQKRQKPGYVIAGFQCLGQFLIAHSKQDRNQRRLRHGDAFRA